MSLRPPIAQSGVVGVLGEFGEWESISGGIPTTAYQEHYEAGARTPDHVEGTTSYTDLVLKRAWRSDRDKRIVDWHNRFKDGLETPRTVTKQLRNYQGIPETIETYAVCKPVSVETPEGQSGDNTIGMITVTLKVTRKL